MGALLSFLFPSEGLDTSADMDIYEYDDNNSTHLTDSQSGFFVNDIIMIHPSIPRLSWIKVVDGRMNGPESFLRVVPLSVYTYRSDPTLDPEHYDKLCDVGDTVLEDNRLYLMVPDFRASILETLGLSFLSPYTYTETQVVQLLTAAYEAMINAALATTYTTIRFPPLSLAFAGPWVSSKLAVYDDREGDDTKGDDTKNGKTNKQSHTDYTPIAKCTAQALATACSRQRLAMIREQQKSFELVLTADEKDAFTRMIQVLT